MAERVGELVWNKQKLPWSSLELDKTGVPSWSTFQTPRTPRMLSALNCYAHESEPAHHAKVQRCKPDYQ